ncbi:MAG: L-fucose:H+ symporter permease, partial [Sediminibacterium sp.]|nr:L-fucose:H+ symporter permease [Sediminibacterium sp.]
IILTKGFSDEELNAMSAAARQVALASEASSVKTPYFILGTIILVIAVLFVFIRLPEIHDDEQETADGNIFHALRHRHLRWAVAAQFFYVGAQVCIFSFFILYAIKAADIDKIRAADYLGWGCGMAFMIGRFFGTFLMRFIQPARLLAIYSLINVILCGVAMVSHGLIAVYAMIGISFFMSIMFPTIFSLGIKGLTGSDAKFGSSLIIMAIVGGAVVPPVLAQISDMTDNIQNGYIAPLLCFVVVFIFGWKGYRIHKNPAYVA